MDYINICEKVANSLQKKGFSLTKGNRNDFIFRLANALNRYGVPFEETMFYTQNLQQEDFDVKEIESTVRSAYKNVADHAKYVWK